MDEACRQVIVMGADVITAAATATLAGTAIYAARFGIRQLREQMRIAHADATLSTLWHLEDSWMSEATLARRKKAAAWITSVRAGQAKDFDQYVDEVLDFFDLVGLLLKSVPLDPDVAWHRFYYPAVHYWFLTRSYIERERTKHPQVWEDFDSLVERLREIEATKRGRTIAELTPTDEELAEFLEDEKHGS